MAHEPKCLMKTSNRHTQLAPVSRIWLGILSIFSLFGFARADDVSGAVVWWLIFIMIMLGGSIAYLFYLVYFKKEPLSKKHPQFTGEHDVTTIEENLRRDHMERNKQNSKENSGRSVERLGRRDPKTLDDEERKHQAIKSEHIRQPIDIGSIDVQENSKLSDDQEHGNKLNMPRVATSGENSHRNAKQPTGILKNGINIAKNEIDPSQAARIVKTTEQAQKQVTVPQVKAGVANFGAKLGADIAGRGTDGIGVGGNEDEDELESEYEEEEEEYEDNQLNNIRATGMNIQKQVVTNVQSQASSNFQNVGRQIKSRPDD